MCVYMCEMLYVSKNCNSNVDSDFAISALIFDLNDDLFLRNSIFCSNTLSIYFYIMPKIVLRKLHFHVSFYLLLNVIETIVDTLCTYQRQINVLRRE